MSRTIATGSSAAGLPEEGAMQQFWSVLAIVAMSWPSVSSAFTLEFSAEQTVRKGAQSMTGKIYFQPDRWRVEMASPDGPKVAIHRLDKTVTWLLLPNKTYVELPFRFDQIPQVAPKLEGEVGRKRVGKEQVGGRPTEKYEVTVEVNGRRSEEHTSELQSLTNLVCRLLL